MNRTATAAILALGLAALPLAVEAAAPKAVVVEAIVDVGTVPRGESITATFELRNDGDEVLEIRQVSPSCGCTVASFDKTVAPGETGTIHAVVNTANLIGSNAKTLTVFTNDPDNAKINLSIRSNIKPYIFAVPGYARYNMFIQDDRDQVSTQTLWAADFEDLKILSTSIDLPYVEVSYREAEESEKQDDGYGRQWVVEVTMKKNAPIGPVADVVKVTTNHPVQPTHEIPFSGFVRPLVVVSPPQINFGAIDLAEGKKRGFIVRSFGSETLELGDVVSDIPGFDIEVSEIEKGVRFQVLLTPTDALGKGDFKGKMTIRTNFEKKSTIEVDISGSVK